MKLSEFFSTDYVDFASYDNLRKIANVIDGQKNSSRKILYTVLEKKIKDEVKVSQLGAKVAEFTEYLHGNLDGVIVNLAQTFVGTNNLNLLVPEGNFGTRFNQEAAASRYIYSYGSKDLFKYFSDEDNPILIHQSFEGQKIEPRFYVPDLPIILINGSEGISSGFAQKILPRSKKQVIDAIKNYLTSGKISAAKLTPHYNGFNGSIVQGDSDNQWIIKGVAEKVSSTKVIVTEVPIGYELKDYIDILDALEEKKEIVGYRDLSTDDNFKFEIQFNRKTLEGLNDDGLLQKLKLIRRVSENYTCMNENNKIIVFDNIAELLEYYIKIKIEYMTKRKTYKLEKLLSDTEIAKSKYHFIKAIIDGKLVINNRPKQEIVENLINIPQISMYMDSYDYLLNMNMLSLTKERLEKLEQDVQDLESDYKTLLILTETELWLQNLD